MSSITDDNYDAALDRVLNDLHNEGHRAVIEEYLGEKRANDVKSATLYNNSGCLRDLSLFLGDKPFEEATKADIIRFVNQRRRERVWRSTATDGTVTETRREVRLSESTMALRKQMLRTFYKWLLGDDEEYPRNVRFLKTTRPDKDRIPTDQLVTTADMDALLTAHVNPRDKAMLAVLYESGLRAGELCALRIRNAERDEYGFRLVLPRDAPGLKTGARVVRIFYEESGQHLFNWLEQHPFRGDPDAPLFVGFSYRNPGAALRPSSLHHFVVKAGQRAKLAKHINPHLFRHTAATQRAGLGWTEAQMRAFFGWSRGSSMPATYVHLAGKDYEEMELKRRGLIKEGTATKSALRPTKCPVCQEMNLSTAWYCQRCRRPITPEAETDMHRQQQGVLADLVIQQLNQALNVQAQD